MAPMTRRLFAAAFTSEAAGWGQTSAEKTEHESYMRQAIGEARKNTRAPFGAVIVDRGKKQVVARGFNKASQNPTWHGEIDAINRCAEHSPVDWKRLTLYTTAEPCPMCQSAT